MMMISINHLHKLIIILLSIKLWSVECLSCRDESGKEVDWFIVYKIPKLKSSQSRLKSGYGYAFITDKSVASGNWILSNKLISSNDSILGYTLAPLYHRKAQDDMSIVSYNDQPPDLRQSSSSAHAKGVFAYNPSGGFWLIHSIPKFPPLNGSYEYPKSATSNGQTAICISVDNNNKNIDNVAIQLLYMKPKLYAILINDNLYKRAPHWKDVENKKWIKTPFYNQLEIKSAAGIVFESFSKGSKYEEDLYSGLVASNLKVDLLAQTWRNGAGDKLDSDCTDKYKVQNIDRIKLDLGRLKVSASDQDEWNYTEDHSKWLVATDTNKLPFTCIGDINRMKSQFKRGGGTVCIKMDKLWNIFKKSVASIEGCKIQIRSNGTNPKGNNNQTN